MTPDLRIGVVGVGYLGRFHARIYSEMPGVRLVGVADVDAETAERVAAEFRCTSHTDPNSLVDSVDAVSIVVPTIHHAEVARPFLESGVHMLMEKPIAPSYEDSCRVVEWAERAGVVFQVGFLERFNAGVMELAERVLDPRFIEVHRLSTFVERATDVDVITDLMIHDIDIVLSLIRSNITHVSASGVDVLTDHIDIANARLEFANGAVANVTASRVSNKKHRRIRVFAHKHYYGLNYVDQQLDVVATQAGENGTGRPRIVAERIEIKSRPPLDAELEAFIAAVRTGSKPLVDGRAGLEAMRVANLVKERIAACNQ